MLIGLDPLLGPDLLAALRAMGHGDEIALVDANFPAAARARRLVRCDGHTLIRMLSAIVGVLPLDDFDDAVFSMAVVGDSDRMPETVADMADVLHGSGYDRPIVPLERHAFYDRAAECFAIVATGETRLYGNVILRKGVIRTPGAARGVDA